MKRIVPFLALLSLVALSASAQEAFTKAGIASSKNAAAKFVSANSSPFKVGVAAPAVVMASAQASYTLCASVSADPKCPKTAEVSGTARISIRGADGKSVASSEVTFRQSVTAEAGKETASGSIPLSLHLMAPSLLPGTYTAELDFKSAATSQPFTLSGGRIDVIVLKSRLK